jgi:hypothetical protein
MSQAPCCAARPTSAVQPTPSAAAAPLPAADMKRRPRELHRDAVSALDAADLAVDVLLLAELLQQCFCCC